MFSIIVLITFGQRIKRRIISLHLILFTLQIRHLAELIFISFEYFEIDTFLFKFEIALCEWKFLFDSMQRKTALFVSPRASLTLQRIKSKSEIACAHHFSNFWVTGNKNFICGLSLTRLFSFLRKRLPWWYCLLFPHYIDLNHFYSPWHYLKIDWCNVPMLLFIVFNLPPYGFTLENMYQYTEKQVRV